MNFIGRSLHVLSNDSAGELGLFLLLMIVQLKKKFLAVSRCLWALDSDALCGNSTGESTETECDPYDPADEGKISWQILS